MCRRASCARWASRRLERAPFAPDVPTLAESGLPGFSVQSWFAVMAPAGTPEPIVAQLNQAINQGLAGDALTQAYKAAGFVMPATPNTPATLQRLIDSEIDKWGKVVTQAGLKVQ